MARSIQGPFSGLRGWVYSRFAVRQLEAVHGHAAAWARSHERGDGSILDVGCGPGRFSLRLGREIPGNFITGADPSSQMIRHALQDRGELRTTNVRFVLAPAEKLPFGDAQFDLALSLLSIKHWNDPKAGLGEILRVLIPGGQFYLCEIDPDRKGPELDAFLRKLPWPMRGGFVRRVQANGMRLSEGVRSAREAGFERVEGGHYSDFPGFFLTAAKPGGAAAEPHPPSPSP